MKLVDIYINMDDIREKLKVTKENILWRLVGHMFVKSFDFHSLEVLTFILHCILAK